jgi:hypothetical protein
MNLSFGAASGVLSLLTMEAAIVLNRFAEGRRLIGLQRSLSLPCNLSEQRDGEKMRRGKI